MPRNSLLNGEAAPDTGGTQLDEAAYPILLAYLTGLGGNASLYTGHIRPAADFLVANGPSFGVERWEEQSGFSPSTIAAEIAGLTAASAIAKQQGDTARADLYQATADDFQRNIENWTVTTTGPDGPRYFIRLSKTGDPNAAISYSLGNGGPTLDQRSVLDGGFQELVRLGELPVSDSDVQASLGIIDSHIAVTTPSGTGYYRYGDSAAAGSADGYGDCYQPSQTSCSSRPARHGRRPTPGPVTCGPSCPASAPSPTWPRGTSQARSRCSSRSSTSRPGLDSCPSRHGKTPSLAASPYGSDPATAFDRLHRRQGGRLGVTADLGAGAGAAADPVGGHRQQRRHAGAHHQALRQGRRAWRAAGVDRHPGERRPPRQHVHHRDRHDHAEGEGDDRRPPTPRPARPPR